MNKKGFTLVELLCSVAIIGILTIVVAFSINKTMSISDENAYEILKTNIISISKTYINECENGLISCQNDYMWENDETNFLANKLVKHNYFKSNELVSPITNKDISSCLIINAKMNKNKVLSITLDDSNC